MRGIPAHIVMPRTASRGETARRRSITAAGSSNASRPKPPGRSTAAAVVAETGATLIAPFDHPDVIAGQGTAALELLDELPELDAIVTPVGGGGLTSGTCLAGAKCRAARSRVCRRAEGRR